MHKAPGVAMLPASSRYLGLPIVVSSAAKGPYLPPKPASAMALPSGTVDGGWKMLWARIC